MPKLIAFLDLDGPLLDVSERHFQVYSRIVSTLGGQLVAPDVFWAAKRRKVSDGEILSMSGLQDQAEFYLQQKLALIEHEDYLAFDRLQREVPQILGWIKNEFRTVLVTLRRCPRRLDQQLTRLGLASLLDDVLTVVEDSGDIDGWNTKVKLVQQAGFTCSPHDLFIGDTETDIRAGQALGARTISTTNGIRDPELLKPLGPWLLLPELASLTPAMVLG